MEWFSVKYLIMNKYLPWYDLGLYDDDVWYINVLLRNQLGPDVILR